MLKFNTGQILYALDVLIDESPYIEEKKKIHIEKGAYSEEVRIQTPSTIGFTHSYFIQLQFVEILYHRRKSIEREKRISREFVEQ